MHPKNRARFNEHTKAHHHLGGTGVFTKEERLRAALLTILDQVDYTGSACSPTEMVGAVLPAEVIEMCRNVLKETQAK